MAISIWLYPLVLGLTAEYLIPSYSFLPKNQYFLIACMTAGSALGASLCAGILAFPLGFLAKDHPLWLGLTLGIFGAAVKFVLFPELLHSFNWFVGIIAIGT